MRLWSAVVLSSLLLAGACLSAPALSPVIEGRRE